MNAIASKKSQMLFIIILVIGAIALAIALNWPRGDALAAALQPLIEQQDTDRSLMARSVLDNYRETRSNATQWSGVYWGVTFLAAIFSALAGLILKFESVIKDEKLKKDVAAVLSVAAALLITVSTGGDFQRKWQANRVAASELEQIAYELLDDKTASARKYFTAIGTILHKRNLAIVGNVDKKAANTELEKKSTSNE